MVNVVLYLFCLRRSADTSKPQIQNVNLKSIHMYDCIIVHVHYISNGLSCHIPLYHATVVFHVIFCCCYYDRKKCFSWRSLCNFILCRETLMPVVFEFETPTCHWKYLRTPPCGRAFQFVFLHFQNTEWRPANCGEILEYLKKKESSVASKEPAECVSIFRREHFVRLKIRSGQKYISINKAR